MDEIILLKYLDGNLSVDECKEVEIWYNSAPENKQVLEQLYYTKFIDKCVTVFNSVDVDAKWKEFQARISHPNREIESKRKYKFTWRKLIPYAAFLAGAVFIMGLSSLLLNQQTDFMVATASGQRAQFLLPDGSKVWLNSSTKLIYKNSFWKTKREVDLVGEAYFEVFHNKRSPFIVNANGVETKVLGTKFNIRSRQAEDRVVATLLQGSIGVNIFSINEKVVLVPNQILEYDTKTRQLDLITSSSANEVLLWIDGRLKFKEKTLYDITTCLERHYDVNFTYADEKLKDEVFTCHFSTDDDLNDILFALSLTKVFKYNHNGNKEVIISSID